MKHFGWLLILLAAAMPSWSADSRKITVEELKDLLGSLHTAGKSDNDVANQLKQVELTEELTPKAKESLAGFVSGQYTTEQIYVLEARSALLPPPASDLPSSPAPDSGGQQALLGKAANYVNTYYDHLPTLNASKVTARFQDGVEGVHGNDSMHSQESANGDILRDQSSQFIRLVSLHTDPIEIDSGTEKIAITKEKLPWGANNIVASIGTPFTLNTLMQEVTANGGPKWLRWETVNGKQTAVFSFNVEKKKSHYSINYCCFPDFDPNSSINYGLGKGAPPPPSGKDGQQAGPDWKNFKASAGYHGELFLDPDTGAVVRTITEVEFKSYDFVRSEAIRTDYARTPVGDKSFVVPEKSFTLAVIASAGDAPAAKNPLRHTFVTQTFKDFQVVGSTASAQK